MAVPDYYLKHTFELQTKTTEQAIVLYFNLQNKLLHKEVLSQQMTTRITLSARAIFKPALLCDATSFILLHNHPSGSAFPSTHDCSATFAIAEAAKLLGIELIDHIIVARNDHFSFRAAGIL